MYLSGTSEVLLSYISGTFLALLMYLSGAFEVLAGYFRSTMQVLSRYAYHCFRCAVQVPLKYSSCAFFPVPGVTCGHFRVHADFSESRPKLGSRGFSRALPGSIHIDFTSHVRFRPPGGPINGQISRSPVPDKNCF